MTTPKPRSSFLPLLLIIVGLVICVGVVVAFVPLVACPHSGRNPYHEYAKKGLVVSDAAWCNVCSDNGKLTLLNLWVWEESFPIIESSEPIP